MRMQFFEQWKKACEKAGLDQPSYEHGLISAMVKRLQAMLLNGA
jgi:hypothetical protein